MIYEPGDVICRFRRKYEGMPWWKNLVTKAICFFTREWWHHEKMSLSYHTEMIFGWIGDGWKSVTMEPPRCRVEKMPKSRIAVYRLVEKPDDFDKMFEEYVVLKLGRGYDYCKIVCNALNWIFRVRWFTRRFTDQAEDICSEFVARFYIEIGIPISPVSPDETTPDDIHDFFMRDSHQFKLIYEIGNPMGDGQ